MKLETKAPVQSRFATPASASPSGGQTGGSGGVNCTLVGAAIAVTAAVAAVMIVVIRRA